jgi:hypothetical protein
VIDFANLLNGPTAIAKQQTVNLLTDGVILKYENAQVLRSLVLHNEIASIGCFDAAW